MTPDHARVPIPDELGDFLDMIENALHFGLSRAVASDVGDLFANGLTALGEVTARLRHLLKEHQTVSRLLSAVGSSDLAKLEKDNAATLVSIRG